jgi:hypothetical protein
MKYIDSGGVTLMSMTKSKKSRLKWEREGGLNPEILRGEWVRKPQTQVKPNNKAEQRRSQCRRKGSRDGADLFPHKVTTSCVA